MRILKVEYCNRCPFFETEMDWRQVNDDYEDYPYWITENKTKEIPEIKCYCCKVNGKYMRLIKNLGTKYFELETKLSIKMEKEIEEDYDIFIEAQNELDDNYIKELKIDIPEWCPLEKKIKNKERIF